MLEKNAESLLQVVDKAAAAAEHKEEEEVIEVKMGRNKNRLFTEKKLSNTRFSLVDSLQSFDRSLIRIKYNQWLLPSAAL